MHFSKTLIPLFLACSFVATPLWADSVRNHSIEITPAKKDTVINYSVEIKNDTLFLSLDDSEFPEDMVLVINDRVNIYRRIFNDETDDLMENHPADDLYRNIWTREMLNPYNIPIDSLPDSVYIDCSKFCMPHLGHITSKFGPRRYRYHYGTDVKLQTGDTVRSAFDGQVRIIDYQRDGYGHYVVIRHDNGLETVYAHMSRIHVRENERVVCGQPIGLGGNTGRSTGSHLHFEIRYLGNAINPELLVDFDKNQIKQNQYLITKANTFYHHEEIRKLAAARYHNVKSGETLGALARRYSTTVNAICRLNGIKSSSVIRVGQRLRVR